MNLLFVDGSDYEEIFETEAGPVWIAGMVQITARDLFLRGVAIYPAPSSQEVAMKHYTPAPIASEIIAALRTRVDQGITQPALIQEMRTSGYSQSESIKLIRLVYDLSLGDAKHMVHFSETWSDDRDRNETIHETAISVALELGFSEPVLHERRSGTIPERQTN